LKRIVSAGLAKLKSMALETFNWGYLLSGVKQGLKEPLKAANKQLKIIRVHSIMVSASVTEAETSSFYQTSVRIPRSLEPEWPGQLYPQGESR
jgi:hypothetical protein